VFYVFGALLVVTGVRMAIRDEDAIDPSQSRVLRLARRLLPVTVQFHGTHFFVRENGRLFATPLLLVLIFIEFSDLIFAIDSIPAIFAITLDPFIVYTSNVFAILGLRSMYFLLAGIIHRFVYLRYALAFVLVFVGVKMLLEDFVHIPILVSLGVIAASLVIGVVVSLRASADQREEVLPESPPVPGEPLAGAAEPGADVLPKTDEEEDGTPT
jgi:tellurite resistance protein TerC